jgi:hypothetical protein
MTSILRVFVREECAGCGEARRIAAWVKQAFPKLRVELIDVADPHAMVPEAVFATPTYMLNSHVVSLGNPSPAQIARWAAEVGPPLG